LFLTYVQYFAFIFWLRALSARRHVPWHVEYAVALLNNVQLRRHKTFTNSHF